MKIKLRSTISIIWILFLYSNISISEPLTVYYKPVLPFLTEFRGIPDGKAAAIISKYAIDTKTNLTYTKVNTISDLIQKVESNPYSIGIGAVSVNHDRLDKVNFTLPYHITDTVLAYKNVMTYDRVISQFVIILYAFKPFFISILVVSILLKLTKMPFITSFYLTTVVATTVGFGDVVPKGFKQKFIIIIWMLVSTYFLSLFTSVLTVTLNNKLDHDPIKVGVIIHTEAHRVCTAKRYNCSTYDNIEDLISSLRIDQIDSIIHDREIIDTFNMGLSYNIISNSMHSVIMNKKLDIDLNHYIRF